MPNGSLRGLEGIQKYNGFKPDSAEEVASYLREQLKLSETEC